MDWLNKGPSGDEITGSPYILSVTSHLSWTELRSERTFKRYHRLSRTGVPQRNSRKSECQSHQTHAPVIDIIVIQSNLPDVYNLHWMIADSKIRAGVELNISGSEFFPPETNYDLY